MKKKKILTFLVASLFQLVVLDHAVAQTFTTLHNFAGYPSEGAYLNGGLILSGNTLYGTTQSGGSSGNNGTVFKINANGTGFTNLYSFTATPLYTNSDGANPSELVLSGNTLYGTTYHGGSSENGTVFAINTNGAGFTTLHNFTEVSGPFPSTNSDGARPYAGLILSGNTLYGTTPSGGSSGSGTVFKVNTNGTGFTTLHSFIDASDGASPAELVLSGNTLYGTTSRGGTVNNLGTVFAVNTDGTGFTNLHSFTGVSDGANPDAGLILSGNTLYGTASAANEGGGVNGTIFAINTNGTGFTTLHNFTATPFSPPYGNSDGADPVARLILSGTTLYGTAVRGGNSGNGTVFAVNIDGTSFTNLHSFTALSNSTNSDGANLNAGLILSSNTLYGAAYRGGSSGFGTIFSLSLSPPQLSIIPSGANVILKWPTYAPGVTLQSTMNLVSPAVWSTNPPAPVLVNGQNTVTNAISGTQKFYRLSQ
ncbi:MAG: hypothetical protein JWM68_1472 [Verrucomicrobiales bacterium]|nr:hypothetical protein [Verrucomicrobiales bacterium]